MRVKRLDSVVICCRVGERGRNRALSGRRRVAETGARRCERKKKERKNDGDDSALSTTTQNSHPLSLSSLLHPSSNQAEAEASAATPSEAEAEAAAPVAASSDDAVAASASASTTSARFGLNFLWLDKNVGVAVDALHARAGAAEGAASARAPLTEYFMWPRKDAWEELKAALEAKPWVPERDRVLLLNRTTEVINFWQDEGTKHTVEKAREKFPDCVFSSS